MGLKETLQLLEEAAKKRGATPEQAKKAAFSATAALREKAQTDAKQAPPPQAEQPVQG